MPKYYFDHDGRGSPFRDEIGDELADVQAAYVEGTHFMAELARKSIARGEPSMNIEVVVRDDSRPLWKMTTKFLAETLLPAKAA